MLMVPLLLSKSWLLLLSPLVLCTAIDCSEGGGGGPGSTGGGGYRLREEFVGENGGGGNSCTGCSN